MSNLAIIIVGGNDYLSLEMTTCKLKNHSKLRVVITMHKAGKIIRLNDASIRIISGVSLNTSFSHFPMKVLVTSVPSHFTLVICSNF
jgi:hypothetical protein